MIVKVSTLKNTIAIYSIVVYFYFYQFFEAFGLKSIALGMLALSIVCNFSASLREFREHSFSLLRVGWLFFLCILLFHNEYMKLGNYGSVLMPISALILVLLRTKNARWCEAAYKAFIKVGIIHVIATIVFSLSNSLYLATMPKIWGYFPVGTQNGLNGAAAGLTRHYSYNGIYCVTVMILCAAPLFTNSVEKFEKKKYTVISILALLSVILTQKRAHLLFGVLSIVMLYLFCGYYKALKRIGKIIIWGICGVLMAGIISMFIPAVEKLFARFQVSGDTDISTGRYAAWAVGFQLFEESKMFGKGWFYFPLYYNRTEFPEIHNIYIQFLCETGLFGTIIMICTMFSTLFMSMTTFKRYRYSMEVVDQTILAGAVGFQVFTLMYGLTGCCMTDITVIAYLTSVAFGISIYQKYRFKNIPDGLERGNV